MRDSVQVLYDGLTGLHAHCDSSVKNLEREIQNLAKRLQATEQRLDSRLAEVTGSISKQLQGCIDREGEHFRNVWNSVGQMCLEEREAQSQGIEVLTKSLQEVKQSLAEEN